MGIRFFRTCLLLDEDRNFVPWTYQTNPLEIAATTTTMIMLLGFGRILESRFVFFLLINQLIDQGSRLNGSMTTHLFGRMNL